jgi:hypothetical protein
MDEVQEYLQHVTPILKTKGYNIASWKIEGDHLVLNLVKIKERKRIETVKIYTSKL